MRRSYGVFPVFGLWCLMRLFNILHFIVFSKKSKNIAYKGKAEEGAVSKSNSLYGERSQIGEEDQDDKTDEEDGGADLSCQQSAGEDLAPAKLDNGNDKLEAFFYKKQRQDRIKNRIAQTETNGQRKLSQFIGEGVQELTNIGYHIKFSGNLSIHHISQAGDSQNGTCQKILTGLVCVEIDVNIDRQQNNPEKAEQIGDGKQFFFPVFDKHG